MRLLLLTWNTHGSSLFPALEIQADILIASFQECYTPPVKHFKEYPYYKIYSLYGIHTLIWSKNPIKTSAIRIGLGPLSFINKGFIAVAINDEILHINAHLSAHASNNTKRMKQIRKIFKYSYKMNYKTVVLNGDLNFRSKSGKDQARVFLREYGCFKEAAIGFKPTYKYEGHSLSLKRVPSYCDRIFVASDRSIEFEKYSSLSKVIDSDHKPVYLLVNLGVIRTKRINLEVSSKSTVVPELITQIYDGLYKSHKYAMIAVVLVAGIYFMKNALRF